MKAIRYLFQLFVMLGMAQIIFAEIPQNCKSQNSQWYKKAKGLGKSHKRTICIEQSRSQIVWYNTDSEEELSSIVFTHIDEARIEVKAHSLGSMKTSVNIPLLGGSSGRKMLILYCKKKPCQERADKFVRDLKEAIELSLIDEQTVIRIQADVRRYLQNKKYKLAQVEARRIERIAQENLERENAQRSAQAAYRLRVILKASLVTAELKRLATSARAIQEAARRKLRVSTDVASEATRLRRVPHKPQVQVAHAKPRSQGSEKLEKMGSGQDKTFYCCKGDFGWLQAKTAVIRSEKKAYQDLIAAGFPQDLLLTIDSLEPPPSSLGSALKAGYWVKKVDMKADFKPKMLQITLLKKTKRGLRKVKNRERAVANLKVLKAYAKKIVKIVGEVTIYIEADGSVFLADYAPNTTGDTAEADDLGGAKVIKGIDKVIKFLLNLKN